VQPDLEPFRQPPLKHPPQSLCIRSWRRLGNDVVPLLVEPGWSREAAVGPGLSDAEIVSNIGNEILHPLAFSEIR
jgi:hypothetical protein